MAVEHIVKSFDEELNRLAEIISRMGGLAERQIAQAMRCVATRDIELAGRTVEADIYIDDLEHEVDEAVTRMLALRQPMATDLRHILAALRISSDLERIGDYATNVAKRSIAISQSPPVRPIHFMPRMATIAQEMVNEVLDAYIEHDVAKAKRVWERDEELDEMYTSLFRELLTYMMEDARSITPCTHLLFVAKNIERIGDHATNIAETVHFLVTGERLNEMRPKGDTSSTEVPEAAEDGPAEGGGSEGGKTPKGES